jgi:hypothetical protein
VYLDAYLNESKLFYEVAQDRWAAKLAAQQQQGDFVLGLVPS